MTCIDLASGPARTACAPRGLVLADEPMVVWLASVTASAELMAAPRASRDAPWPFESEPDQHLFRSLAGAAV